VCARAQTEHVENRNWSFCQFSPLYDRISFGRKWYIRLFNLKGPLCYSFRPNILSTAPWVICTYPPMSGYVY
jgi:hypothetical protein